jgi:myxalamid-type polyketide synthase MxaB
MSIPDHAAGEELARGREIAIIGMSGRFPRALNVDEFWRNLAAGIDAIRPPTPEDRADARLKPEVVHHPNYVEPAYFLDGVKLFDAEFFGFTPAEARITDPQHRIFMECVWEALESAGYISRTADLRIGLYAGASVSHYMQHNLHASMQATQHPTQYLQRLIGNDKDYLTTHVSYKLNLRGPSVGVQTACSTSLVSLWLACQALCGYECDLALAGGVTVKHATSTYLGYIYEQGNILSPDGRCRPFDASAGGTAFGSGAGVVLLKRLDEAIADRDTILAVVKEAAVNNDGGVKLGFTAPSLEGQAEVVGLAQATAGVHPETIGYIEAHGTGTPLGDPVEIAALTKVFRARTRKTAYCAIGSVKSNVGHLESAAGVAGLIKVVMALQHKQIPPSLHFGTANPEIDFAGSPFYVNTELKPWPANGSSPRRAGISSFGIGGTNAHVIVEEAPAAGPAHSEFSRPEHILTLSATDPKALLEFAERYTGFLASDPPVQSTCHTSNTGRRQFRHRLAAVGATATELRQALVDFVQGRECANVLAGNTTSDRAVKVAFLFTGQGSQYVGMAHQLYVAQPVFRAALDHCAAILEPHLERPLLEVLYPAADQANSGLIHQTAYTQPALFAVEYALAKLWQSWGIQPAVVLGHSIGEYVAACLADVFSLEDGLSLVAARGRLMQALPAGGGMVAVLADEQRVRAAIAGNEASLAIAAVNGPQHTVVSGRGTALEAALAPLTAEGVRCEKLTVSHAFHSPLMEPMLSDFRRAAERVTFRRPAIPLISNVTGGIAGEEIASAEYWAEHALRPVRFAAGMRTLAQQGCGAYVEVGPHPVLLGMGRQCLTETDNIWLASLRRQLPEWRQMLLALGRLYVAGAPVSWENFDKPYRPGRITQPTYPFQRQRYWVDEPDSQPGSLVSRDTTTHALLGRRLPLAGSAELRFEARISGRHPAFLSHHLVFNEVVVPMAAYLESALAAGVVALGTRQLVLEDVVIHQPLVLREFAETAVQTVLKPHPTGGYGFEIYSQATDNQWLLHATGRVLAGSGSAPAMPTPAADADNVDVDEYYRRFTERGMSYGQDFRTIHQLRRTPDGSVAEVGVEQADGFVLHPALLDGCLQASAAAHPSSDTLDTYVPAGLARLELFGEPGTRVWSHARVSTSIGLDLFHHPGELICRIEGLSLRRVSAQTFGWGELHQWLYGISWKNQPRTRMSAEKPGTWLIVSNGSESGQVLATELRRQGQQALVVKRASEVAARPPDLRGTVHFGEVRSALDVAQHVDGPVWFVTRGAQSVGDAPGQLNVDEAPVWGLGRTLALELPESGCRLVDLDPSKPARELDELADELLHADSEDQVALRGGHRFVPRLDRWQPAKPLAVPAGEAFRLAMPETGVLADTSLQSISRWRPAPGMVEVSVLAAGLNFRDVLQSLGVVPTRDRQLVGSECAGTVSAIGQGVTTFKPGDRVIALAAGSLASHITLPQEWVFAIPEGLTPEEAAGVSVVFLTAQFGLHQLAKVQHGERILIHAAAGGVGQAAIQLARLAGLDIFATASAAKWAFLEAAGIRNVMSSRTLDFAERVLALTGGQGVDVVLNSLNGPFIEKSFQCLRRGGRFIEIGKLGTWDEEQVRTLRPDVAYFRYDIAEEMERDPLKSRALLAELMNGFHQGRLRPPRPRVFPVTQAPAALHLMAAGRHVGKIVLSMDAGDRRLVRRDGSYLIAGGMGGLGLKVARWLATRGAGRVVVCGRSQPSTAVSHAIEECARDGTQLDVVQADITSVEAVEQLISIAHQQDRPLRGIVHTAGVLRDGLLKGLTWEDTRQVLAPKVEGAWNLHLASRRCPLDFFLCFSSTASVLGSAGQANYAAANAFLDALAYHRQALGLPGLTINWGPWAEVGMAARLGSEAAARRTAHGVDDIEPELGLQMMEHLLSQAQAVQAIVMPIDWRKETIWAGRPLFETFGNENRPAADTDLLRKLKESTSAKRELILTSYLATQLAMTLGSDSAAAPGPDEKFRDLGIDSLLAIELRNRVQADLGVPLAQTVIFDYPTLRMLVEHVQTRLFEDEPSAAAAPVEDIEIDDLLNEIGSLSESEVKRRLGRPADTR